MGVASVVSQSDVVSGPTARTVTPVHTITLVCRVGCSQTVNMETSVTLYTLSASLMRGKTLVVLEEREREISSRCIDNYVTQHTH